MSRPGVYLAGPITGLTWDEAHAWREPGAPVADILGKWGTEIVDPLEGQKHLDPGGPLPDAFDGEECARRDLALITGSTVVLANLLQAQHVSIGTMIELGYAYALDIPIVTVMGPNGAHDHVFLRHVSTVMEEHLTTAAGKAGYLASQAIDRWQIPKEVLANAVPYA